MNLENTQRQKQVDIDVLKIFVSGSFVKEDFIKTHGMKFNPNYELQMEFQDLDVQLNTGNVLDILKKKEKKRKCSTNNAPWGSRTRIQCVRNENTNHETTYSQF